MLGYQYDKEYILASIKICLLNRDAPIPADKFYSVTPLQTDRTLPVSSLVHDRKQ